MTPRTKWLVIVAVSAIALGGTVGIGVSAWAQYQQRQNAPSSAETAAPADAPEGDRILFRNTASGEGYGHVASVPLDQPDAARAVLDLACDRVAATDTAISCLKTERGITPSYNARLYDAAGTTAQIEWPLPGIPSRTRFSPDGTLVATTSFVTGHAYASIGFSTETSIHRTDDGASFGSLEDWSLIIDGEPSAPVDRNYWGVTFIDDTSFYATVGMTTIGQTYLVKGDIQARTMTSVLESVECPSLSPDGTRIAFKRVTAGSGPTVHWTPAIYDIADGSVTVLDAETRNIDDQIAWLDDDTLLYGMPNDTPGDSDVWALPADGGSAPGILIAHAWSPTVVHEE
ncbi:PD40 domain-containing protein [Microbacterium aerolatum]|uniref:TolB-like translocation protein signal peptide n=1 Tax=Microbacterium aerolatum TaxID=153731 RepID=A0A511ADJ7_9MICO|nr:PD40 domain-containing protein [Microbacterium aerolatum]GEK86245.1 TolB-like translocation protein; signal peptide [Microbacterium aerolatum]GGB16416.1 TolB-like translocation protein; signal peptide [Microbacterium aerolatum]